MQESAPIDVPRVQRRAFPGALRQPCLMRRWIQSLLLDEPARDDVLIVATEVASNAIRHNDPTACDRRGLVIVRGLAVRMGVRDDQSGILRTKGLPGDRDSRVAEAEPADRVIRCSHACEVPGAGMGC